MATKQLNSTIHALGCGYDFSVQDGGSIYILRGHSEEAAAWIEEHCVNDETQRFGGGIAVEHRYIANIVNALLEEGFTGKEL